MRRDPINWLSSKAEVITTLMYSGLSREEAISRVDNPEYIRPLAWRKGEPYFNQDDLYYQKISITDPSFRKYYFLQCEN